jgi:hypothetical protein
MVTMVTMLSTATSQTVKYEATAGILQVKEISRPISMNK